MLSYLITIGVCGLAAPTTPKPEGSTLIPDKIVTTDCSWDYMKRCTDSGGEWRPSDFKGNGCKCIMPGEKEPDGPGGPGDGLPDKKGPGRRAEPGDDEIIEVPINPKAPEKKIGCSYKEQKQCNDKGGVVLIRGSRCSCVLFAPDDKEPEKKDGRGRRAEPGDDEIVKASVNPTAPGEQLVSDYEEPKAVSTQEAPKSTPKPTEPTNDDGRVVGRKTCCIRSKYNCYCEAVNCEVCEAKFKGWREKVAEMNGGGD